MVYSIKHTFIYGQQIPKSDYCLHSYRPIKAYVRDSSRWFSFESWVFVRIYKYNSIEEGTYLRENIAWRYIWDGSEFQVLSTSENNHGHSNTDKHTMSWYRWAGSSSLNPLLYYYIPVGQPHYLPHSVFQLSHVSLGSRGEGGVLGLILGGSVPPGPENPYPISDQNIRFSIPYFRPDSKMYTLFQICAHT